MPKQGMCSLAVRQQTELVFVVALHAAGAKKITATFVTAIFADGNAVN